MFSHVIVVESKLCQGSIKNSAWAKPFIGPEPGWIQRTGTLGVEAGNDVNEVKECVSPISKAPRRVESSTVRQGPWIGMGKGAECRIPAGRG